MTLRCSTPRPRAARLLRAALTVGSLLAAGALIGCASPPDPETTRDSLTQVTEEPQLPEAAEEYDAERRPEPIVDPLDCSPYLVLTVKGTGEPEKGQLLSPVARLIADSRPDETLVVDLDYPADTDVKEGGTVGVRTLIDTLNVQAEACPEQRTVLLGYSQGALVVGDALAEPEARLVGPTVGRVADEAAERILAIVLYGDPRFVGAEPYNAGSYDAETNGLLPRPAGSLEAFADRLRDYCVARDFVCQSSLDLDEEGHVAYFDNGMQEDGAAFVMLRLDPLLRRTPASAFASGSPPGPARWPSTCRATALPSSAATSAVSTGCSTFPARNTPGIPERSASSAIGARLTGASSIPAARASSLSAIQSPVKTTVSQRIVRRSPVAIRSISTPSTRGAPKTRTTRIPVATRVRKNSRPGQLKSGYASARGCSEVISTVRHPARCSVRAADQLTSSAPTMTARAPGLPAFRCTRFCSIPVV